MFVVFQREQANEMVERMMKEGGFDATARKFLPILFIFWSIFKLKKIFLAVSLTKPYLITYNCSLFVGFFLIVLELALGYIN